MFDRFIRLARAKKALQQERWEDALQLALDPQIRLDRRAEELRAAAVEQLVRRAERRLQDGDLRAARATLDRLRAAGEEARTVELQQAIAAAAAGEKAREQAQRDHLAAVRAAIDGGRLTEAAALLAAPAAGVSAAAPSLQALLDERRQLAAAAASQAEAAVGEGALPLAIERLVRAMLLDRDGAAVAAAASRVQAAAAPALAAELRVLVGNGELLAALRRLRAGTAALPALRLHPGLVAAGRDLAAAAVSALRAGESLAAAAALAAALRDSELPLPDDLEPLLALLPAAADAVRPAVDPVALAAAARRAAAPGIVAAAERQTATAQADADRLSSARAAIDAGQLDTALERLHAFLGEQPLHEEARRELAVVEQGLLAIEQRLVEVRGAVRSGRLHQACTAAAAVAGSARAVAEAQQIVQEARARMALVDRGLDEVRVALHGRGAATQEGVRHCLLRLEELAKVQVDHAELPAVITAVGVEVEALALLERTAAALARQALPEVLDGLSRLLAMRPQLLRVDRIDARLCDLVDRLAQATEVAQAAGRLQEVERCALAFADLAALRPEFPARAAALLAGVNQRRAAADRLVAEARLRLGERDLAEAERLVEAAVVQWQECPAARAMATELRQLRVQGQALDRVQVLTAERDFLGAQQQLQELAAGGPMLRTRIYDMKQNLVRAQGLEGAFLLRVDEGGEHLVLRGESVSIGNVRQARADLPVLANLAGRHASIRRSMSFHGGMQDTIVADEGEVRIGGALVTQRPLAAGDRVQLGPALGFCYQRPSGRSLTAALLLQSGFQVAGTDRILLLKDRGRDGRILIGPGKDVHVRVARATAEVELFTTSAGQVRVACPDGGTIDGVPFRGEHPVDAGQIVAAGGIGFVLLPWRPTVR